jgi:hypothetical protein
MYFFLEQFIFLITALYVDPGLVANISEFVYVLETDIGFWYLCQFIYIYIYTVCILVDLRPIIEIGNLTITLPEWHYWLIWVTIVCKSVKLLHGGVPVENKEVWRSSYVFAHYFSFFTVALSFSSIPFWIHAYFLESCWTGTSYSYLSNATSD